MDILRAIQEQLEQIDTSISLEVEKPTEELKNALEIEIDQSQLPEEFEKYLVMNLGKLNIQEFWRWFWFIKEFQIPEDPRRQFVNFLKTQEPYGLSKII